MTCVTLWVLVALVCPFCENSLSCTLKMWALFCMLDLTINSKRQEERRNRRKKRRRQKRGFEKEEEEILTLSHLNVLPG